MSGSLVDWVTVVFKEVGEPDTQVLCNSGRGALNYETFAVEERVIVPTTFFFFHCLEISDLKQFFLAKEELFHDSICYICPKIHPFIVSTQQALELKLNVVLLAISA
jgi:hypothetical protein